MKHITGLLAALGMAVAVQAGSPLYPESVTGTLEGARQAGLMRPSSVFVPDQSGRVDAARAAGRLRPNGFPQLLGMNIGEKNYDDPLYQALLARLDIVILGFYRGWRQGARADQEFTPIREVVRALKQRNPRLLVGQYTVLNEASADPRNTAERDKQEKLQAEGWWLTNAAGSRLQWTSEYNAWDINITGWTRPDANGLRYPEWLAHRDHRVFFEPVPEFDIWYFDNVMSHQRIGRADWKGEGSNQSGDDGQIRSAFRQGQAGHWRAARQIAPRHLFVGNADNDLSFPEFHNALQGVFLEGLMGKRWSLYNRAGWKGMMRRYHDVFRHLASPRLVGFNVAGKSSDYRLLRFALASCLMNDGYFSFTDEDRGYSSVPWFDEYDLALGKPLDFPQTEPWQSGVYRRRFEFGMALVNPGRERATVRIEAGYVRLRGTQAPEVNDGRPVSVVVLNPGEGLLLQKR